MDNGVRFEYKINIDEKKSNVSVTLYIVIQRNGFIATDEEIATSKPTKYTKFKRGETDADSLGYILANLKAGVLKDLISESQDLILYRYSEVIDPNKVTERITDQTPSGITRAEAERVPSPTIFPLGKESLGATQNLTPNGIAADQEKNYREKGFNREKGINHVTMESGANYGGDLDALRTIENSNAAITGGKTTPRPDASTEKKPTEPANFSNFSVGNLDKNNQLIDVKKEGDPVKKEGDITNINNKSESNNITKTSSSTYIESYRKEKSNYELALDPKTNKNYTKADIKRATAEIKKIDKNLDAEIKQYNKENPDDNTYRSAAEIKKNQENNNAGVGEAMQNLAAKSPDTKPSDILTKKTEEPPAETKAVNNNAGVAETFKKLAEETKKTTPIEKKIVTSKPITEKKKKPPLSSEKKAIIKKVKDMSDTECMLSLGGSGFGGGKSGGGTMPAVGGADWNNYQKELAKILNDYKTGDYADISKQQDRAGEIDKTTVESEKLANNPTKVNVKKATTNTNPLKQVTQTKSEKEQLAFLESIKKNTSKGLGGQSPNINTNNTNNINNQADAKSTELTGNQMPNPTTGPDSKESKKKPKSADNSQSDLNSQLLNAIYDLLITGIKVKQT